MAASHASLESKSEKNDAVVYKFDQVTIPNLSPAARIKKLFLMPMSNNYGVWSEDNFYQSVQILDSNYNEIAVFKAATKHNMYFVEAISADRLRYYDSTHRSRVLKIDFDKKTIAPELVRSFLGKDVRILDHGFVATYEHVEKLYSVHMESQDIPLMLTHIVITILDAQKDFNKVYTFINHSESANNVVSCSLADYYQLTRKEISSVVRMGMNKLVYMNGTGNLTVIEKNKTEGEEYEVVTSVTAPFLTEFEMFQSQPLSENKILIYGLPLDKNNKNNQLDLNPEIRKGDIDKLYVYDLTTLTFTILPLQHPIHLNEKLSWKSLTGSLAVSAEGEMLCYFNAKEGNSVRPNPCFKDLKTGEEMLQEIEVALSQRDKSVIYFDIAPRLKLGTTLKGDFLIGENHKLSLFKHMLLRDQIKVVAEKERLAILLKEKLKNKPTKQTNTHSILLHLNVGSVLTPPLKDKLALQKAPAQPAASVFNSLKPYIKPSIFAAPALIAATLAVAIYNRSNRPGKH